MSQGARPAGPRAWFRTIPDLIRTVPAQRVETAMSSTSPAARVVALGVVALLATQQRLFASTPRRERAPLLHAVVQAWWAPVAGLLGFVMILAGIGTIFETHNWGGRIICIGVLRGGFDDAAIDRSGLGRTSTRGPEQPIH